MWVFDECQDRMNPVAAASITRWRQLFIYTFLGTHLQIRSLDGLTFDDLNGAEHAMVCLAHASLTLQGKKD